MMRLTGHVIIAVTQNIGIIYWEHAPLVQITPIVALTTNLES